MPNQPTETYIHIVLDQASFSISRPGQDASMGKNPGILMARVIKTVWSLEAEIVIDKKSFWEDKLEIATKMRNLIPKCAWYNLVYIIMMEEL